ncbi:MAG: sugar ABC transporter permease [Lachnospiraceae bacterium]|nr:sugar ABC transporter permease [Lachnospiraceae bacterium]
MAKKEKKQKETSAVEAEVKETKKSKKKDASPAANSKKKKKKYTVEEILAAGNDVTKIGADGKKPKIKVRTKSKLKAREARYGYFFTFPWIIGACVFLAYPIYQAVRWSFVTRRNLGRAGIIEKWAGLENYKLVFTRNADLWSNLGEFLMKVCIAAPLIVVFALLMAMLLNTSVKGKGLYRTIFFLPVVVVSGPTMSMMLNSGDVLTAIDMTAITSIITEVLPLFMANAITYVFQNIVMFLWYSGVQILIFIAALQKIDTALYEAAKIDGGSGWECFWKITLPTIRPMILLNAVYTVVALSQDANISPIISEIQVDMLDGTKGVTFASAYAMMYTIVVLIVVGAFAFLLMPKKDIYEKQIIKNKRMEKRTRRSMRRTEKRIARNNKKFAKQAAKKEAKEAALRAKGKLKEDDKKGGRFDE